MKRLRKEDLSVYLYLKDLVLSEFIEYQEADELVYSNNLSSTTTDVYEIASTAFPSPFERGRGLVYFDEGLENECMVNTTTYSGTAEQSNRITVYDSSMNIIDDTNYIIDYVDGRVIMVNQGITPTYIDYYWNYTSVVDEWSAITAADPPVIVVDMHGTNKMGYQLGPGKKIVRHVIIHIFSTSPAERNDLTETLYDNLYHHGCPLYDFPQGSVLDHDGTFFGRRYNLNKDETLFDRTTVSGTSRLTFENVVAKNINLPLAMSKGRDEVMLSDLNAYRAKITFDLWSYTNS